MSPLRIGIVGLGRIAENVHIPILSTFKDVKIVAVSEIDVGRGSKTAKKWKIPKVYEDYNEMYERANLDAVFVCLPNFLHYYATKRALENNLHAFCEKPMGLSSEDAHKLVTVAKKKNLVLAVGYNRRFNKNYEKAHEIIRSLRLGKILQIVGILVSPGPYVGWIPLSHWFFDERSGGVLYDLGAHLFDLITYITSDRIVSLTAESMSTYGLNIPDNVTGIFKTGNGSLGTFSVGWRSACCYETVQVYGTAGSMLVTPSEVKVRSASYSALDEIIDNAKTVLKIVGANVKSMRMEKIPDETYFKEDKAFIDGILNPQKRHYVSGEVAFNLLRVFEAAEKSLQKRKPIDVELV